MLVRLYLVYFLSLFAPISFANEANWNCQQDKASKKWDCVGSAEAPVQPSKTVPESQGKQPLDQSNNLSKTGESALPNTPTAPVTVAAPKVTDISRTNNQPIEIDAKDSDVEQPATVPNLIESRQSKSPVISEAPPVSPASQKPVPADTKPTVSGDIKQRGWNCDTKGADGNWNCQLVGTDPKGEARVVEAEEQGIGLFDPAFNNKEEQVFNTLRDRFKTNPWGNCTIQLGTQKYYLPGKSQRDAADLDMDSNYSEIYDNQIGNYQGNVEMKRADQRASSNSANYDTVSENLDLHGNVFYSEDELAVFTDTATLKLASDEARLRDTLFISPTTPIRGKASAVYRDSKSLSRYKDAAYTTCEPGNQDWVVHASDLKLNKKDGQGAAKNAWVEFKGVPVFYSPYLSFPTDDRRKTGFLAPSFGNTQKGGFNLTVPFYWNIAPNYDATLRPRYYSSRGGLLAGDFRFLTEKSKGLISAEYMPNDSVANKPRYLVGIKNSTRFTPNISSNLDLNAVSDREYFSELGNALSFPNFSHIRSTADTSFIDEGISLVGRIESYQTIDPNIKGRLKPYRRLPQLNLNLDHSFESMPVNVELESEYVYFQHDDTSLPDGNRFNIKPSVNFPLKTASAYVTPKLSLQHTQYLLGQENSKFKNTSVGRTLPIASIDSGVFLEKDVNLFGNSLLHSIEPRLFYLYIPRVNQSDIPIFDSSLYDFWFPSLFRENRFSGTDRIQDANQITAAVTSKLIDSKTGLERLKLSLGQIFYFQDREVTAPVVRIRRGFLESRKETSTFSPLVAELGGQFNQHLSVETGLQWNPEINDIVRGKAVLHFVNEPGEIINVGYTYRKNTLIKDTLDSKSDNEILQEIGEDLNIKTLKQVESLRNSYATLRSSDIIQTDVSFRWPIYDNWFGIGRWQYSLLYDRTQEAFFGLEKENCCWRFRVIGRRYVNNIRASDISPTGEDTPGTSQDGIFFQIELKGLTGIGNSGDIGDFFTQSIYGYRKSE